MQQGGAALTTRYDLPPTSFDLPGQDDPAASAPWMPLDALVELWASFGNAARNAEALNATSAVFAALSHERAALHLMNRLHEGPSLLACPLGLGLPAIVTSQQPIIEALTLAALRWFEAACFLSEVVQASPSEHELDALSPGVDLQRLLGCTLVQRERVWAIAHSLLVAHLQPYRLLLNSDRSAHRIGQEEQQGGVA